MDKALGVDEASDVCGAPVATMAQWRRKGTGPAWYRSGKRVMYRPAAIEAWMLEQETEQTRKTEARKSA